MSESSAEVRLQVVHPVPAFFVLDSRLKKTGESETISAAFFSSPGAERQKGGQNAYIEKGQGTGRTSLYCGLYAYLRCQ